MMMTIENFAPARRNGRMGKSKDLPLTLFHGGSIMRRRRNAGKAAKRFSRPRLWKTGKVWHHAKGLGSLFGAGPVTINRSRRRKSRKNPGSSSVIVRYGRKVRRSSRRRNPVYRRRSSRRTRRNPFNVKAGFKGLMKKNTLVMIGSMGAGIVGGMFLKGQVESMMAKNTTLAGYTRFSGVASMLLGGLLFIMGRKAMIKQAGAAMAAIGLYDVVQQNANIAQLPAIPAMALGSSYPVNYAPVSRVAMGASYPGNAPAGYVGSSYQAPDSSTQGFSGGMDNPFENIFQG